MSFETHGSMLRSVSVKNTKRTKAVSENFVLCLSCHVTSFCELFISSFEFVSKCWVKKGKFHQCISLWIQTWFHLLLYLVINAQSSSSSKSICTHSCMILSHLSIFIMDVCYMDYFFSVFPIYPSVICLVVAKSANIYFLSI